MAREMVLSLNGEVSRFNLTRVQREKLYGKKRRVVVNAEEEACEAAFLSRDGSVLIPPGGIANLYVDESYNLVERGELQAVDEEGGEVAKVASTLGVEQTLTDEVDASRVLDHVITAVYQLSPPEEDALGEVLSEKLKAGKILESRFAYRAGYEAHPLFLMENDVGLFALVGKPSGFDFIERDAPPVEEEEEAVDPFEDDFDFSMM